MSREQQKDDDPVVVGKTGATYGVKGWLHVHSYTSPPENLRGYSDWLLQPPGDRSWQPVQLLRCEKHKKGLIAAFAGVDNPQDAQPWVGSLIAVPESTLPRITAPDEYYWRDLLGCRVENSEGQLLGTVRHLLETGANDVLCVAPAPGIADNDILIPFTAPYVLTVAPSEHLIVVDWEPDW